MWAAMKLEHEGYEFTRETLSESDLPRSLVDRHSFAVEYLTSGQSPQSGTIARIIRSMTAVREGITDRHIARYIVNILRIVARSRMHREVNNLVESGQLLLAAQLASFWRDFCRYTLREISEKPEMHHRHEHGA